MTRYSSISKRKLSTALTILTSDKCMVAMSDYNDFHKMVKKHILASILGANAQVRYRMVIHSLFSFMVWMKVYRMCIFVCTEATPFSQRGYDGKYVQ